jgi:hypothetical protein
LPRAPVRRSGRCPATLAHGSNELRIASAGDCSTSTMCQHRIPLARARALFCSLPSTLASIVMSARKAADVPTVGSAGPADSRDRRGRAGRHAPRNGRTVADSVSSAGPTTPHHVLPRGTCPTGADGLARRGCRPGSASEALNVHRGRMRRILKLK